MSDIPQPVLKKLLLPFRSTNNHVILEIGANDGFDTKMLLAVARNAHVHCFECDPRAIARWRTRVKGNRVTLHETALSDTIGEIPFHPSGGNPGGRWESYGSWDKSGSILPFDRHHENAPWMEYLDPITVPTTTLDDWAVETLPEQFTCGLVWMDVQGAEDRVIRGGMDTLQKTAYVFCECDPRPNYKDQATKRDITEALDDFDLIEEYPGYNLLFKNRKLAK